MIQIHLVTASLVGFVIVYNLLNKVGELLRILDKKILDDIQRMGELALLGYHSTVDTPAKVQ